MQFMMAKYCSFNLSHSYDACNVLQFLSANKTAPEMLPDIIFVDLNMPHINGWQFLEEFQLLRSSLKKAIDIYVISSSIDPRDIRLAGKYRFVKSYIVKPITKDKLLEINGMYQN
jgi:two-component SAPR family response regulator